MRLTHCRLRNVRLHAELALPFAAGLTVIGGANETGKTTLVEALHRALFLKASASGAPVEALRSRLHPGHPEVEIGFEARGEHWTLLKRFSGASGTISLSAATGAQLTGPAAEERLAELLGVREILGSKQAQSVLPTRWAHLWVLQGQAGADLLERGGASYDLATLLPLLEKEGGAALQSPRDQAVAAAVDALLDETFTGKRGDVRRNSPLWTAGQACQAARTALELAEERLAAYDAASDELADLAIRLERLQEEELPDLETRRAELLSQAAKVRELQAAVALRVSELRPLELELQRLEGDQRQLGVLDEALQAGQTRLQALERERAAAAAAIATAGAALAELQTGRQQLEAQRRQLDRHSQLVQRLLARAHARDERARLARSLQELEARQAGLADLERRLQALPATTAAHVQRLRDLELAVRDARTRQQALAAGVELLRADRQVVLADEPLLPGQERRLTEVSELRLGEGIVLRISPGGGRALAEVREQLERAEQALAKGHRFLGVESVEAAETQLRQREALQQELAARRGAAPPLDPLQLRRQLDDLDTRLLEIEPELEALASVRTELERTELELPEGAEALDRLHGRLRQTLTSLQETLSQRDRELEQAARSLEQARLAAAVQDQERIALETDRKGRAERRRILLAAHPDPTSLATAVAALQARLGQGQAEVASLHQQLAPLLEQGLEKEGHGIEAALQRLRGECQELVGRQGAARQRCDSISAADPYGEVERCRVALEGAEADLASIRRRTEALQLLRQLFSDMRADLSARYSEPLATAISRYLQPLLGDGAECQCRISYDQVKGFTGLQLRRGSSLYSFSELSGGMREQLAAALRLSMADVLRAAHGGTLPLVFDDAFTNSDPQRIAVVRRMLSQAVQQGLQVILLTCDPAPYADLDGSTLVLPQGASRLAI